MSGIQTQINRPEVVIKSSNQTVRQYAVRLKSTVISNDHKKALLNEMKAELTSEQYRNSDSKNIINSIQNEARTYSIADISRQSEQSVRNTFIKTGGQISAPEIQHMVDRSILTTQKSTDYIKTARITYSNDVQAVMTESKNLDKKIMTADKIHHRKVILRNMQIKQMQLKNKRYITAKSDSDNSSAIEMVQTVHSAGSTVVQSGGILRTAVKDTAKGVGSIKTMVTNGVKIGSAKDIGRIVTAVGGGLKNATKDSGTQLLKTKIDKSTITDTGTETIKQGLTEARYVSNVGKAVLNTARTSVKAGYAIKNMPRNTRIQAKRIRKSAKLTVEAAKKAGSFIVKAVTSKAGIIIILAVALILILVVLISGLTAVVVSAICSLFSWMLPNGENTSDSAVNEVISGYVQTIDSYVLEKQAEIDAIIDGLPAEYRTYEPYSQIDGLNRFGNRDIQNENKNSVIAILAVIRYRELQGNTEEMKLEFSDDEIHAVTDKFYNFSYYYTYEPCPNQDCCREWIDRYGWQYYCNTDHKYLNGEVTNYSADDVMDSYGFTDEEKDLYSMYLEQINGMTGG